MANRRRRNDTIDRVMLEAKEGDLEISPVKKVRSRKQAVAIALREGWRIELRNASAA